MTLSFPLEPRLDVRRACHEANHHEYAHTHRQGLAFLCAIFRTQDKSPPAISWREAMQEPLQVTRPCWGNSGSPPVFTPSASNPHGIHHAPILAIRKFRKRSPRRCTVELLDDLTESPRFRLFLVTGMQARIDLGLDDGCGVLLAIEKWDEEHEGE